MKLMSLLPFMESHEIKELADKIVSGEVKNIKLTILYPFLKSEDIAEIIDKVADKGSYKQIYSALPFLRKEAINRLYERVQNGELEGFKEQALIPFLGKEHLKTIFDQLVKEAANQEPQEDEDSVDELFDEEDDK